jgi:hypothetical protein
MARVFNKYHRDAPAGAQYIGRGSPYGNRFVIGQHGDRNQVCDAHDLDLARNPAKLKALDALKGKSTICFCYPQRCHSDSLVKLADMTFEERMEWARETIARLADKGLPTS